MEKKYKLEKEFATKWIAALRGGKYKQGQTQLKEGNTYCCLGVACKIVSPKCHLRNAQFIQLDNIEDMSVSREVYKSIPELLRGGGGENLFVRHVSEMNDGGKTFDDIADWIEKNCKFI